MKPSLLAAVSLGAVLLSMACDGGDSGNGDSPPPTPTSAPAGPTLPPIPTLEPRETPTPVAANPPGTRTDVAVIDGVLEVVESKDPARLVQSLSFHPFRCDRSGAAGSNPCPPGVAVGSAIDVVAYGGCDAGFLARDSGELEAVSRDFFGPTEAGFDGAVYAAVEVMPGRIASPLPIRYLVIFAAGNTLILDDAGITHIGLPCAGVGPATLFHPADRVILAPP